MNYLNNLLLLLWPGKCMLASIQEAYKSAVEVKHVECDLYAVTMDPKTT